MVCVQPESSALSFVKSQPPVLTDVVKRYQVCWEVWPEYVIIAGQERQVGFDLELSGTHESATQHSGPGCLACRQIYSGLHAVAEWVLPKQAQPIYRKGPCKTALRYSAVRVSGCNDVLAVKVDFILKVPIVQLTGFEQTIDQCEMRALRETKQHLAELGTSVREWSLGAPRWSERVDGAFEQCGVASLRSDE